MEKESDCVNTEEHAPRCISRSCNTTGPESTARGYCHISSNRKPALRRMREAARCLNQVVASCVANSSPKKGIRP